MEADIVSGSGDEDMDTGGGRIILPATAPTECFLGEVICGPSSGNQWVGMGVGENSRPMEQGTSNSRLPEYLTRMWSEGP